MTVEYEFYIASANPDLPHYGGVLPQQLKALVNAFPEFEKFGAFSGKLNEGDPKLAQLLGVLEGLNLKIPEDRSKIAPSFSVLKKRTYQESDYDQFEFFSPVAENVCAESSIGGDGAIAVDDNARLRKLNTAFGCLSPFGDVLSVTGVGLAELQKYELTGLEFRDLPKRKRGVATGGSGLYLLASSYVMPPCQNKLFNNRGEVWEATSDRELVYGCHILDGSYSPPEIVYRRVDFPKVDCVLTNEKIGNGTANAWRRLLVSQRFRHALQELDYKCRYIPVRFT